ncbi:TadE/TadG family type IV pilus assembly protein [Promicromonospora sp. NPDC057138]|uniref:TadE/TadG family type IV pilus assembly protein n=1 Tax=Promicromonospora sp. NPDC057138 TaxID=3346031 RepID=UPI00363E0DAA
MTRPTARTNPITTTTTTTTTPRCSDHWSARPRRFRRWAAPCRREAGIAAIEVVVTFPAIMLLGWLVLVGASYALAQQSVQSAAADAARTASLARTAPAAQTDAYTAASMTLANQDLRCTATDATVDTTALMAPPGQPAAVTATVTCRLDPARLGVPVGPPLTIQSSVSSPVDTWRSR